MPIVFEDMDLPGGVAPMAAVEIYLAGPGGKPVLGRSISTGKTIVGQRRLYRGNGIDADGQWQETLVGNDDIEPAGTTYRVIRDAGCFRYDSFISVPVTGGPYEALDLETDPLNAIDQSTLAQLREDMQEPLFYTAQTVNQGPVTSTSFVDMTNLVATFDVPPGPFALEANIPLLIEADPVTGHCEVQMTRGAGNTAISTDRLYGRVTNTQGHLHFKALLPAGVWTPTPGETVTVKMRFRSSAVSNQVNTFLDFGGNVDVCWFRGYTLKRA
jgi:hypothetical protein